MKLDRRFHCFGCQADGDVIDFVSRLEHISRMIAKFKLDLRPAMHGQIINIGVYTPEQAATIPLTPLKVASNGSYGVRGR